MTALQMVDRYGTRQGRACETCAALCPRSAPPKAHSRNQKALTTFTCTKSWPGREPWSVLAPACGAFEEA